MEFACNEFGAFNDSFTDKLFICEDQKTTKKVKTNGEILMSVDERFRDMFDMWKSYAKWKTSTDENEVMVDSDDSDSEKQTKWYYDENLDVYSLGNREYYKQLDFETEGKETKLADINTVEESEHRFKKHGYIQRKYDIEYDWIKLPNEENNKIRYKCRKTMVYKTEHSDGTVKYYLTKESETRVKNIIDGIKLKNFMDKTIYWVYKGLHIPIQIRRIPTEDGVNFASWMYTGGDKPMVMTSLLCGNTIPMTSEEYKESYGELIDGVWFITHNLVTDEWVKKVMADKKFA